MTKVTFVSAVLIAAAAFKPWPPGAAMPQHGAP
jgi:hypothetical protein